MNLSFDSTFSCLKPTGMKKILLLSSVICISIVASSQVIIPKGKTIIGGSFSFSTSSLDPDPASTPNGLSEVRQFSTGISPSLGFATKDNAVFGILMYSQFGDWESKVISSGNTQEGSGYAAGPGIFYEKFFGLGKNFHFSAMGSLRGTFGKQNYKEYNNLTVYSETESKVKTAQLALTPFLGYSINNKWMVQASVGEILNIGYTNNKSTAKNSSTPESKSEYSSFSVNSRLNQGLRLGSLLMAFRYTF